MKVSIEESCPKITQLELTEFEIDLKARLPTDYRNFLLAYNGGKPSSELFDVDIDGFKNTSAVTHFLCMSDSEEFSFKNYLKTYMRRLPVNLLPIATPLSVDLICISIAGHDFGTVYFWDHNWEVTERAPDYENVHFLAENFNAFLEILYDDPPA